jgi:hypothetical protein
VWLPLLIKVPGEKGEVLVDCFEMSGRVKLTDTELG